MPSNRWSFIVVTQKGRGFKSCRLDGVRTAGKVFAQMRELFLFVVFRKNLFSKAETEKCPRIMSGAFFYHLLKIIKVNY